MKQSATVIRKFPGGALQLYISEYVFRTLIPQREQPVSKAMPLRVSSSIDFFLGHSFKTLDCKTNKPELFKRCTIRGPRTHNKYTIEINRPFVSFTIKFKPAGLYRLLGIPANLFCNEAIDGSLLCKGIFMEITDRLMSCVNISECIQTVEPYLLQLLHSRGSIYASQAIDQMTGLIFKEKIPANISRYFAEVCSSKRQLERNFIKEVGTSPKLYCNMVRFENLLKHRITFPEQKWTILAHEFNYYDQMHLIRNFEYFLGIKPGDFNPENYAI